MSAHSESYFATHWPCNRCSNWCPKTMIFMEHETECAHDGYYCRKCRECFESESALLEHLKKPKNGVNLCSALYVCCKYCGNGTLMTRGHTHMNKSIKKAHQEHCLTLLQRVLFYLKN